MRPWQDQDRAPFAELNADPEVMRHFPATLTREESDAAVDRYRAHMDKHGFGLWATVLRTTGAFVGSVGISIPRFEASFTPCTEVGWRVHRSHWNQGYATEAARAAIEFGFREIGLREILSFTPHGNVASRRVMEKLGMTRRADDDFDHPLVPAGHPLRPHVLYRLTRAV